MHRRNAYPLLFSVLLSVGAAVAASPAARAETGDYLHELKVKARESGLADEPYWDILLHYKKGRTGRYSLVDDSRFFLSPQGQSDPASELAATLTGFFQETAGSGKGEGTTGSPHPRCRFPARYEWLKERLSIDAARLPAVSCGELDNTLRQMNPKSATLIFASAHMNAPASMFGHTLVRVDSSYQSPLLSYAVNYAARIDRRDNGLVYAFKGIFGLYPGYYSILPYYDKVKEYGNMDQRDLWEYRLNLTEEEVRRMVLHIYELQDIYSDYFFFDENCSYNLLFLLEAARPSASLTSRKGPWVIPVDTVVGVLREGLVEDAVFRPSQVRTIRHTASLLDDAKRRTTRAVIDGSMSPKEVLESDIRKDDQIKILDIASEYTQLRYTQKKLPKEDFQKRFVGILSARSRLGVPDRPDPPLPVPERPESGHASSRATLSAGARGREVFLELSYRPAYHEMSDPQEGFTEGSQIEFFTTALRYYPKDEKLRLQRWDLLHIFSAAPRDEFFRPVSWKIRTGLFTKEFANERDGIVYTVNPGGGLAWKTRLLGLTFVMLETEANVSSRYDKDYAVGLGASLGTLKNLTGIWKALAQIRFLAGVAGDTRQEKEFSATLRQAVKLARNRSLFLDVGRTFSPDVSRTEGKISLNVYF